MGQELLGLCTTCIHREVCTSRKGFRPPILYCEEFDITAASLKGQEAAPAQSGAVAEQDSSPVRHTGLCSSCAVRKTCVLSTTPGGVWHCEEYR